MQDIDSKLSKKTIIVSVVLHALLLGAVLYSYNPQSKPTPIAAQSSKPIVNAVALDKKALDKTIAELNERKHRAENKAKANLKKLKQEKKALEAKRKKEERRLAKLKTEEAKRIKAEKAKLAKLQLKKKEAEAARKEEKARLVKLKAEQEKLKKARQAEEQRLAAIEQRRAEEKQKKKQEAARVAALKAQKEAKQKEQERLSRIQSAKIQAEVDRYVSLIKDRIEQQWRRPMQSQSELSCTLFVKLLPNGEVAYAEVRQTSGNASFDDSAIRAVYKASPLPIPNEGLAFDQFRELILPFQPEV